MKILDLVLKGEWFDMIKNGPKREEYREIKPYWTKRIEKNKYTHVKFRRGYTNQSIMFSIENITVGHGNTDWGAPADKDVYIIKIKDRKLNDELNIAIQNIINDAGNAILTNGEITLQEIADKVSEAFKTILKEDKLKFTFKGNIEDFNLIPSDEFTKGILEKLNFN